MAALPDAPLAEFATRPGSSRRLSRALLALALVPIALITSPSPASASGRICGLVKFCEDGTGVNGVQIRCTGPSPATTFYDCFTDANGHYCSPTMPNGSYKVIAYSPNWDTDIGQNGKLVNNNDNVIPDFHMKSCTITGSVRDRCTNAPSGGVTVQLVSGTTTYTAVTNTISGIYSFTHVRQGDCSLFVLPPPNWSVPISQRGTDYTHLGVIGCVISGNHNRLLEAFHRISGQQVSDATGLPVANSHVSVLNTVTKALYDLYTDANGNYSSPLIEQGTYNVNGSSCDVNLYNGITLGCSDLPNTDFRQRGLVNGTGMSASPGADGHSLNLQWDPGDAFTAGFQVLASSAPDGPFTTIGQGTESFVHSGLACGVTMYYKIAAFNSCNRVAPPSTVFSGTLPCPTVSGFVEDVTTHLSVPGAAVTLLSGSSAVASATAAADGSFSMTAPSDGAFTMQTVQADGYWPLVEPITIQPFEAHQYLASMVPVGVPTNVQSVSTEADGSIRVTWHGNAMQTTAYELFSKVAALADDAYALLVSVPGSETTYVDHPLDGLDHDYKVRAVVAGSGALRAATRDANATVIVARSKLSGSTRGQQVSGQVSFGPPKYVIAKNFGDSQTLYLHVGSQKESISFAGIKQVLIDVFAQSPYLGPQVPVQQGLIYDVPNGSLGEVVLALSGATPNTPYWFSARFRGTRSDGPAQYSQSAGAIAQPPPVVLVHGIWGKAADMAVFAQFMHDGVLSDPSRTFRAGTVEFTCFGDNWKTWAGELRDKLAFELGPQGDWPYDERVDLVAHSQGGLASRWFIERLNGASKVRALVMMGTPNHGGEFAQLTSLFSPSAFVFCAARGIPELSPNNLSLGQLNFGVLGLPKGLSDFHCASSPVESQPAERKAGVRYYTIAGTAAGVIDAKQAKDKNYASAYNIFRGNTCASDGVVPIKSVRIRQLVGTSDCFQWTDQDLHDVLGNERYTHAGPTAAWSLKTATQYVKSRNLAAFIAKTLLAPTLPSASLLNTYHSSLCGSLGVEESPPLAGEPLPDSTAFDLIGSAAGDLPPGGVASHAAEVDTCGALIASANTGSWVPGLRLKTPSGTFLAPADTASLPWLEFVPADSSGVATFRVVAPTPGRWELEVTSPPDADGTSYSVLWGTQASPYHIQVSLAPESPSPGDTVIVSGVLVNGSTPVSAVLSAQIRQPDGSTVALALSDDAGGQDRSPGDHVYEGRYVAPAQDGGYSVGVNAHAAAGGGVAIDRSAGAAFEVSNKPDLVVVPGAIVLAQVVGQVGVAATIRARVKNLGTAPCSNASIIVRDSTTAESLGVAVLSLAPGDSAQVEVAWTPSARGEHRIEVMAELDTEQDANDDNNTALATLAVAGPLPSTSAPPPLPVRPPKELALSAPRPNPSRGGIVMTLSVPTPEKLEVTVFDVAGRRVRTLVDGQLEPGVHTVTWDGTSQAGQRLAGGMYFIRLTGPRARSTRRVVILR